MNLGGHGSTHNNEYLPTSSHTTPSFQEASRGCLAEPSLGQGMGTRPPLCPASLGMPSKTIMGCRSSVVVTLDPHPETRACPDPRGLCPVDSLPLRWPAHS